MKQKIIQKIQIATALACVFLAACSKSDSTQISTPPFQAGQSVSNANPLSGSIKGTMLAGETYTIGGDVTVNAGDTLVIQPGVTVKVAGKYDFIIKGTFLSLGTQAAPIWITTGNVKQTTAFSSITTAEAQDTAFMGEWYGLNCDTSCHLFIMKWTHVEYTGATFVAAPVVGVTAGTASFGILFQNINGVFVMEDSWFYGSVDDAVRITSGKVSIMRNTFEKAGSNTGEAVNVKSGTVGDIAYNLFIGSATNGTKMSDAGSTGTQCSIHCYNNTYVDCGFRQSSTSAHGGSINLEKSGQALIYNNIIVNCKKGLRIPSGSSKPDTANSHYGNTYNYGDSLVIVNQFYSVGDITRPEPTDIPDTAYLPSLYVLGAVYDGTSVLSAGNPQFKTFTLPNYLYQNYNNVVGYDFRLSSSSPAIGKGYIGFSAEATVPVDPNFGATEITQPGVDEGAYQNNGRGNKH